MSDLRKAAGAAAIQMKAILSVYEYEEHEMPSHYPSSDSVAIALEELEASLVQYDAIHPQGHLTEKLVAWMTNDVKLEMNTACANLLEYNIVDGYTGNVYVQRKSNKLFSGVFNIFTNAEQCLEAVKKLGEVHNESIEYYTEPTVDTRKWYVEIGDYYESWHETYEEAVGAACVEVMK